MKGNCKDENREKSKSEDSDEDDGETAPRFMSVAVLSPPDQLELDSKLCQDLRRPQPVLIESTNAELKLDKTWEIESIPPASSDYRQSRTMIEVPGRSMHEIARIIFASNKARSIHAVYDNAIVKCKTSSYLKFTIRLLYSPKDADHILVDVRRVSGCALAFRDEYQAIVAILPDESTPRKMHGSVIKSFADLESMDIPDIRVDDDIIERSLEVSIANLESKMYDTRITTLQDLLLTTGPESKEASSTACKLILGNSKYNKILEYVVRDIMKKVENTGINDNDSEEYQRSLSLNILGNLLSSQNNSTLDSLIQESPWTGKLIDILVWYVDMHRKYPWNACLAAKCLRLLASNNSAQHAYHGVYSALEYARCYGNISYDLLEKEAKEAQSVFDTKI